MTSEAESASSLQRGLSRSIGTAALILMLGNLSTSLLGFVRQTVVAKVFGDSLGTDAFFAASIVPQMFYDLTIGAAISAALIPTFTEIAEARGRSELWRSLSAVLPIVWLVLTAVVVALMLAAQPLMSLILWGFHTHLRSGALHRSIDIVRVLIPSLFFLGTSAVFLSTLYSLRRFTAPAFATSLYHLGVIVGALTLARPLGIISLPVGALAGSAAQAAVQVPALVRAGIEFRPRLELTPEVRRIGRLYAPVAAGLLVSIVGQVLDLTFKSQLQAGAITAMQFATTLTQFPIGIAVAALSFAVLPSISSDAAFDRTEQFKDTLASGMRLVLFITIPAAVGYVVLASPIVSLLFQHGRFEPAATHRTAMALVGYAIQIPFVGIDQLLIFAFYARRNTVTPMLIGVLGVGIYVVSALLLMPRLQILGLALANTLQNSLHGLILLVLLIGAMGPLAGRGIFRSVAQSSAAGLAMGLVALGASIAMGSPADASHLAGQALRALLPLALGGLAYIGAAAALRSGELATLIGFVRVSVRTGAGGAGKM